jgi:hypothetical protein
MLMPCETEFLIQSFPSCSPPQNYGLCFSKQVGIPHLALSPDIHTLAHDVDANRALGVRKPVSHLPTHREAASFPCKLHQNDA